MRLGLTNCRNIARVVNDDTGEDFLEFKEGVCNILYAPNGTGKTTLTYALDYKLAIDEKDGRYQKLKSFQCLASEDSGLTAEDYLLPQVSLEGAGYSSMLAFNQEWIDRHCFMADSLRDGVYRLFLNDKKLKSIRKQRDRLITDLRVLSQDDSIADLRKQGTDFNKACGRPGKRGYIQSSNVGKAFRNGGPLQGMPRSLQLVKSAVDVDGRLQGWIKWHYEGAKFIPSNGPVCPYCGHRGDAILLEIEQFDKSHTAQERTSWEKLVSLLDGRLPILSDDAQELVRSTFQPSISNQDALNKVNDISLHIQRVNEAFLVVDSITNAMGERRRTGLLTEAKDAVSKLSKAADSDWFSSEVKEALRRTASALEGVIVKEDVFQRQEDLVEEKLNEISGERQAQMNEFLRIAGYPYRVSLRREEGKSPVLVLVHAEARHEVNSADTVLSYGERNALSLMLFFYEAINDSKALIVLDDPISSFDGDKRFALLSALFAKDIGPLGDKTLSGRTVILTTHDLMVMFDGVKFLERHCGGVHAIHMRLDGNRQLHARSVRSKDSRPFLEMLDSMISNDVSGSSALLSLGTLVNLRRHFEMIRLGPVFTNEAGDCLDAEGRAIPCGVGDVACDAAAFSILSSLLHKHEKPTCITYGLESFQEMPDSIKSGGMGAIDALLHRFDYQSSFDFDTYRDLLADMPSIYLVDAYNCPETSDYERLQIVREILTIPPSGKLPDKLVSLSNGIYKHYADGTYHIGGDYLYQLDPTKYIPVPVNVMQWCDEVLDAYQKLGVVE